MLAAQVCCTFHNGRHLAKSRKVIACVCLAYARPEISTIRFGAMSRGTVSHYSSRNLDACTLQLNRWRPFVAPSASDVVDFHQPPRYGDIETSIFTGVPPTRPLDIKTSASTSSESPALHLVKCSFRQIMSKSVGGERFRWACHPFKEGPSSLDNQGLDVCENGDFDGGRRSRCIDMAGGMGSPAESHGLKANRGLYVELKEDYQRSDSFGEFSHSQGLDEVKFQDVDMMGGLSSSLGIYRVTGYLTEQAALVKPHGALHSRDTAKISMLAPSLSGWSKRHKQLSRALARGLWRWKENSQARKRRRKCGSSRSGSGRSSESRRVRINASDAPTVGASAAYATCSDIPMPGTDSSGELFYGGGIGWDSEISLSGEGVVQRIDGVDVLHAWIVSETQSLESGYGSEPGYRGDGELGYEDDGVPDEQDEEEREQLRLGPWNESITEKASPAGGITVKITMEEGKQ